MYGTKAVRRWKQLGLATIFWSCLLVVGWACGGGGGGGGLGDADMGNDDTGDDVAEDAPGDVDDDSGPGDAGGEDVPSDAAEDSGDDATDVGNDVAEDLTDASEVCTDDDSCTDGVFCNGFERCLPGDEAADARGCVSGSAPCPAGYSCTAESVCRAGCRCVVDEDCPSDSFCGGDWRCDPDAAGAFADGCVRRRNCAPEQECDEDGQTCTDPPVEVCENDGQCSNQIFCDGFERCSPGSPGANAFGCVAGTAACPGECNENADCCADQCPCVSDFDCQDGLWCNGRERCVRHHPESDARGCLSVPVVNICILSPCDEANDCCEAGASCINNGIQVCASIADLDNDGFDAPGCTVNGETPDCNDFDGGQTTDCGVDCTDSDRDGDGDIAEICGGGDCDDLDPGAFAGNIEVCDTLGRDEDCDPTTFGDKDSDGDGYIDNQCFNGDEPTNRGRDCDDTREFVNPESGEICNGLDDDCDEAVDEGVSVVSYLDEDGDGAGGEVSACRTHLVCPGTPGYATTAGDCDDRNPAIGPNSVICTDDPSLSLVCQNGGWIPTPCFDGTRCVPQPNGTGICQ